MDPDAAWQYLSAEAYWSRWRSRDDVQRQIQGAWRVVAVALSVSRWVAEKTTAVAHDLATRLLLTRQALHKGVIDAYKAQVIAEATRCLDNAAAAQAEAAVVPHAVTGKTPGQAGAGGRS